ncbi:MAG: ABC transporter substrate-binding protein [Rhodospirillales bacterium]|jgi:phospholipid transport system substrate-binding protein|nr:ABC transporter substrate-binding protein [Rhodospirillales bacterium]MDP6882652.1 ABC transporter substrate-binding protein [Rhodospirillales bacterium]
MAFRRCLAIGLVGLVLTAAVGGSLRAADPLEARAETFIASLADKAVQALTVEGAERAERVSRFRRLFNDHFAVHGIAKWVLGRYWRRASPDERGEYLILFEDMIVVSYVDRFASYTGEALAITKTVALNDESAMIYSEIVRPTGGPPVRVDWRVATEDGGLRIVDVVVEGTSMSTTLRSDFGSIIRREGGKVAGLLKVLRDKTKSLRQDLGK